MNRYHIVGITTRKYHLIKSFESREEAKTFAINWRRASMGIVLRDGNTGKRHCIAELKQEVA